LSHTSSSFCSGFFGDGGASQTFCLGWPQIDIFPIGAIQVDTITTGVSHWCPVVFLYLKKNVPQNPNGQQAHDKMYSLIGQSGQYSLK
jgi:hypothetical protein